MFGLAYSRRIGIACLVVAALTTVFLSPLWAQATTSPLTVEIRPSYEIALGPSAQYFNGGGSLDVTFSHPVYRSDFYLLGGIEYSYLPTPVSESVSVAAARIGAGVDLRFGRHFSAFGYGSGGYYYSAINSSSVSAADPYVAAGAGFELSFSPTFGIDLGMQYNEYAGLYGGLSFGVGSTIGLGASPAVRAASASGSAPAAPPKPTPLPQPAPTPLPNFNPTGVAALRVSAINLRPIFPIFYAYYADHPIGSLVIKDDSQAKVSNVIVSLYAKEYMDNPSQVNVPGTLNPGSTKTVSLDALFSQSVLTITEGTKSSANVTLSFQVGNTTYTKQRVVVLKFIGRNGMTWSDTRKAAAFVTAQNPNVLAVARGIASYVESKASRPIAQNLIVAMALHEALDIYGLNYVPSPVTPYAKVSNEPHVIDYLQFPEETLHYKSGDCSDLSILYSALLESVGIRTAFITIPGHIFLAFDSGLNGAQAKADAIPADLLIDRGGTEWIPVEVTSIHGGFLKAWRLGANEWYQNLLQKQAGFYPVEQAWKIYQPVGLPGTPPNLTVPPVSQVYASYTKDARAYADLTVQPKIAALEAKVQNGEGVSAMNKLGVLYAQWGSTKLAVKEFNSILKEKSYLPAMLNLGNVYYLKGEWAKALEYYNRASSIDPSNPMVLLQIAKANVELENFGTAKRSYSQLKQLDPQLAERFSYLGMGPAGIAVRSANVAQERRTVIWASH